MFRFLHQDKGAKVTGGHRESAGNKIMGIDNKKALLQNELPLERPA